MALTDIQIAAFASKAWSPTINANEISIATAIALAESGGNPAAENHANKDGSIDYGLWQINTVHANRFRLIKYKDSNLWAHRLEPEANAMMAYQVFANAGRSWSPWTVYRTGAYKQYLARGDKAASGLINSGGWKVILKGFVLGSVDPSKGIAGGVPEWKDYLAKILDPKNWLRVGMVLAGVFILSIVASQLIRETSVGKAAISGIKSAVTRGLVK